MNVAVTAAAEGFPRRAFEGTTYVHTGPSGDGWSSIVNYGSQDALATPGPAWLFAQARRDRLKHVA